jgi:hypothetical protein
MFRQALALEKVLTSVPKLNSLIHQTKYSVRCTAPRRLNNEFEKERQEYKKLLKSYRLKNISEYWERQTKVENEYIEKWNKLQQEKHHRDQMNLRASVVRVAAGTAHHIKERTENEAKKISNIHKYELDQEAKKANRMKILQMLNFDSKTWYTQENIEQKMVSEVLIPDFVYDQTAYYLHLQELAILSERADFQGMEGAMNEAEFIRQKNTKILPLYSELVSLIKQITYDQEAQYLEDYSYLKDVIENDKELTSQYKEEKVNKLKSSYKQLISQWKTESNSPSERINTLHDQLVFLFSLLKTWRTYITLVKMDKFSFDMLVREEEEDDETPIINMEETREAQRDPLKAQGFDDAVTSANEKVTSDSAAESEMDDKSFEDMMKDAGKLREFFANVRNESKKEEQVAAPQATETPSTNETDASTLFDLMMKKDNENLEKEFEEKFAQAQDKERFLYSGSRAKDAINAADFLRENEIESFIPQQDVRNIRDQSALISEQIAEIEQEQQIPDEENPDKLNSSAMAAVYKRELDALEKGESLSRKEKNRIKDMKSLLTKIEEIRIVEGKLLLRVFEMYRPKYKF